MAIAAHALNSSRPFVDGKMLSRRNAAPVEMGIDTRSDVPVPHRKEQHNEQDAQTVVAVASRAAGVDDPDDYGLSLAGTGAAGNTRTAHRRPATAVKYHPPNVRDRTRRRMGSLTAFFMKVLVPQPFRR